MIADQVVALISDDHLQSIVWRDDAEDEDMDSESEGDDREFAFEVTKRNEQEENVLGRPGFEVCGTFQCV